MKPRQSRRALSDNSKATVGIAAGIFVLLYLLLTLVSPISATSFIINNFIVLTTPLAFAASGVTLVLLIGGFDLSVAGSISLSNVIAATTMAAHPHSSWGIACLVLVMGAVIGLVNGVCVAVFGLPALGVTLSTNFILAGIALAVLPAPGGSVPAAFASVLSGTIGGTIPVALLALVGFSLLWLLFIKSRTGMSALAIGGDVKAARLSGIAVRRVQIVVYALAGLCYAAAGLYFSALTATGSPTSGSSFLLTAFAAAALGFVSFRGGRGSAIGAIFGAATLTVIPKFLFAWGIADFWVGAFQGLVILVALTIPWLTTKIAGLRKRDGEEVTVGSGPTQSISAMAETA
ncbi:MAG: ABC transporter permease [Propionibacteriaceae bacterium]|nr:ABC transporter permease [Propionibacteriaceae bacterium]